MWNRSELKTRAKSVLKGHYWPAFFAAFVLTVATGFSGGGSGNTISIMVEDGSISPEMGIALSAIAIVMAIVGLAVAVLVANPLSVGVRRYFTSACCGYYDLGNLGFGFRHNYGNTVKTMLIADLKIVLWGLLFIIPGVVKAYAYSMVPYILADNPNMDRKRALQLSSRMTKGYKGELFVLDLSFIGWYLLGCLACGIGVLFVDPYKHSTSAEAYMLLRHNALQNGLVTMEELCLSNNG